MQPKEAKMTKAQTAAALQEKTQAADHASNLLQSLVAQFNILNDAATLRMASMTSVTRHGRGKHEQDRG